VRFGITAYNYSAYIFYGEAGMKTRLIAVLLAVSLGSAGVANAGCVKGAVVGGVGGHVAGHHGLAGAAIGCVVGHHLSKKKQREQAAQQKAAQQQTEANAKQPAPAK
jgi:hypothetical protein